jgi:hypothetical protein
MNVTPMIQVITALQLTPFVNQYMDEELLMYKSVSLTGWTESRVKSRFKKLKNTVTHS